MANIDSRFICTSDLEQYMVDNSSGLPLSGGIVTFYSDVNRTVLKPVYQLTGTTGDYKYQPLNNPCTLSSSGTFQDALGNNIVPYYYPFTGIPSQNTGVQELYYITVVNSGFVPQFVRQGWPQVAGSGVTPISDNEIDNFIPNGQFLSHNNIVSLTEPPVTAYTFTQPSGSVAVYSQAIAQGGWNFIYSQSSTATFNNSFTQIPTSGGWGINNFPKFLFNFNCTNIGNTPAYRDLRIQWPDVNKLSSGNPPGSAAYTLFFDSKSNDSNSYTFALYKVYYLGTGGITNNYIEEFVSNIVISGSSLSPVNINNIIFSANVGTIGTDGADYVGLTLRGPASGWNVSMSDFLLAQGTDTFLSFPVQTNDQMLSRGVAGWMPTPDPNGQDLYLPLVLTPQGMIFDHSQIATIVPKMTTAAVNNELLCNGTQYQTSGYSPIGIPYSRLQQVLFNSTLNAPIFGTGATWVNAYINSGATGQLILSNNQAQSQTNPADSAGGTATGFTFPASHTNAGASSIGYIAHANSTNANVTAISTFATGVHSGFLATAGNSTMTVSSFDLGLNGAYYAFVVTAISAASLAAGSGNPGLYFTFSNHTTDYYMWFYVNGETDPAPGGTGIVCNLVSTMAAADVAIQIANVISRFQNYPITISGQPTNGAGSYFTFYSNSIQTAVWYQVANAGSQPAGFTSYVMVPLTGSENAANVALATQKAINSAYFAVPDLRGVFLRGLDNNASPIWDIDMVSRSSLLDSIALTLPGTLEFMQMQTHTHAPNASLATAFGYIGGHGNNSTVNDNSAAASSATTAPAGGSETRPVNVAVNYFIKY